MTDVEKSEILHIWHVCDVENVAICAKFIAIHAVLLLNLLFTLFCREISCGENLSPKVHLWRKMTNIRSENGLFQRPNNGITSLWEDLEAKLLTPDQLLGYP